MMVQVIQSTLASDIEPKAVHQMHVFRFHGRGVRTDVESVHLHVRTNDLQNKLPFGLRGGFPGMAEFEGLFLGGHFAGESGDYGRRFQVDGSLYDGRPYIACRHHQ